MWLYQYIPPPLFVCIIMLAILSYLQRNSTSYSVNQDLDIAEMDSKLTLRLIDCLYLMMYIPTCVTCGVHECVHET